MICYPMGGKQAESRNWGTEPGVVLLLDTD